MTTAPSDNKTPKGRIKCDSHHESVSSLLAVCWDLVPSNLTTHRHYRLLRTRGWWHRQSKLICWQLMESIRWSGYVYGQEIVASRREKSAIFRAELPQNKYLTYASLIQVQLPDSMIGKEHVTCCAPVLAEVDTELHSRSTACLLTHLILTSLLPVTSMQAWMSQPNMYSYRRWLWWWRKSGGFYAHPWRGQSRSQADKKLFLRCLKATEHHTILSLHRLLVTFPVDW